MSDKKLSERISAYVFDTIICEIPREIYKEILFLESENQKLKEEVYDQLALHDKIKDLESKLAEAEKNLALTKHELTTFKSLVTKFCKQCDNELGECQSSCDLFPLKGLLIR